MNISEKYILGLKKSYIDNGASEDWEFFEKVKEGVSIEKIEQLKKVYPEIPQTLIDLLKYVDGTYWRKFKEEEIIFYFLGSDVVEYPYYLLSAEQIIENQNKAVEYYSDYIERKYKEVDIDEKIINKVNNLKWLHFSDCMNNGGTSQLFIDFTPSEQGKKGQIIRFLHDPDEFRVIAENFEEYLQKLIDNEYDFINEDIIG
ncbi:SMI1/KNR4 family protein [Faecalibacter macacae]|uniref:SMI1/KNR4 family protein n=1 Tax=Faecalibacter macacae TaxID=1859289 RepID=A0A3L9LZK7_9FLAO|nr:SMI1/KNR4 family protein [Faecalibacter macacae]RLZ06357.1 SMI1/KNR4 family protein [Faecalibacter macacae]